MKKVIVFFLSVSCFSLWANAERVGDRISYQGNLYGQNVTMEMSYSDYNDPHLILNSKTYLDGVLSSDTSSPVEPEAVITMETAGLMVALCSQYGGVHEYLTLSVGKTLTCKISSESVSLPIYEMYKDAFNEAGILWLGPFPVSGIAQMDIGGNIIRVVNYHWN